MAELVSVVRDTLNTDKSIRTNAESRWDEAKKNHPQETVVGLLHIISDPALLAEDVLRGQSAILLRHCLDKPDDLESVWARVGGDGQIWIKAKLLEIIELESIQQVRRKVSDCIQSLANQLISVQEEKGLNQQQGIVEVWPDLLPKLLTVISKTDTDVSIRAESLWMIKEITCNVWQVFEKNASETLEVLNVCFSDTSDVILANTTCWFCELIDNVEKQSDRKVFVPLIERVIKVLMVLADGKSKYLNDVLKALQCNTDTVEFLKTSVVASFMPVLCQIAGKYDDPDVQKLALSVIISLAEAKPKSIVKVPNFLTQCIDVCVHFLLSLDDDTQHWESADDDEDVDDMHKFGGEVIDRLCSCTKDATVVEPVLNGLKSVVHQSMQSGQWKQEMIALVILEQVAEYVTDVDTVHQSMQLIQVHVRSANARVRNGCWNLLVELATEQADIVKEGEWPAKFLPEFLIGFDDPCKHNRLSAMEAFQHYCQNVEREDLEGFVKPIMMNMEKKLQDEPCFVNAAVTLIAVVAERVAESFAEWYTPLMPVLSRILQTSIHKVEDRTLIGKVFECISLLAASVGKERFAPDAEGIMKLMLEALRVPDLPESDPVKEYMMAASERICTTLKADFLPFLEWVLPGILEKLKFSPKELDNPEAVEAIRDDAEVSLSVWQTDEGELKMMVMNSSELEDVQHALECIFVFVRELGKAFAPCIMPTAEALIPVFEFSMGEDVRNLAFKTWAQLCVCAKENGQEALVKSLLAEFLGRTLPKIESSGLDVDALKTRVEGIMYCLDGAGAGVLSVEQVSTYSQLALKQLVESMERCNPLRKMERVDDGNDGEEDSDHQSDDDEKAELDAQLAICEMIGVVMKHNADAFTETCLGDCITLIRRLLQAEGRVRECRKVAMFVACDIIKHLGGRAVGSWNVFLPQMLEDIENEVSEIRQPACYGISFAAEQPMFAEVALQAAVKLQKVVTVSRQVVKKIAGTKAQAIKAAADNAMSALLSILQHQSAALGSQVGEFWTTWMGGLPCEEDDEEAVKNHKALIDYVQQEWSYVVGENGANIPTCLGILLDVYGTTMMDDNTMEATKTFCLTLGEEKLHRIAADYTAKRKSKLSRIVEGGAAAAKV